MRRAVGVAFRMAAPLTLMCACLAACRPGDFDGLSRGESEHEGVDIGPSDEAPDRGDALPDADGEDSESDASALDAQQELPDAQAPGTEAKDAAMIDATTADAATSMDAGSDAQADALAPSADAGPITVKLPILADQDDALWQTTNGGLEELLHFSPGDGAAGYTIEVGTDSEQCRLGLRFALPFGHGAQVLSAMVALRRVGPASDAEPSSTMSVRVFDSDSVAPFDGAHLHATPSQHDPGSVWLGQAVGGFPVGASGAWSQSPDLATLIQHVVDRGGFREGNYIGFVLSPDAMPIGQYAQFRDSFAGEDPALLTITYRR